MRAVGYSIIPGDSKRMCHVCGRICQTHKHHIFGGANRRWSEKYGLYVHLCPDHHNMSPAGIHFDKELMQRYHQSGQINFEYEAHERGASWDEARAEFMRIFGKNYL